MLKLTFHQTNVELMVRAASTIVFNALTKGGCPIVPLSELAHDVQYGYTESASALNTGPKFVRITDLKGGHIDWETVPYCKCSDPEKYLLQTNDLLFARTGATTGKTHLIKDPPLAVFASYLIRVRPNQSVTPEYLYAFFQSDAYWLQISDSKEGSAQPNVNGRKLLSVAIPIIDIDKQTTIAKFLRTVRARQEGDIQPLPDLPAPIEGKRFIIARIEQLAAKVQLATSLRHEANSETEALNLSGVNRLFSNLSDVNLIRIEETCEVRGGIQKSSSRTPGANPRRYITVAHVQRDFVDIGDPRFFEVSDEELQRWRLLPGDVLVIEGNGSSEQIGRAALFRGEIEDCVHQNHVIRVRPIPGKLLPEYLNLYFNSLMGRDQMLERSRTTSGLFNLSVGRIKEIEIPLPSLENQRQIVAGANRFQRQAETLRKLQSEAVVELNALMPSILSKALRGEL